MTLAFWESPERVAEFADRAPDHRLLGVAALFPHPPAVRALDLGCAGGRNTVLLTRRGFRVEALDASRAMVEETRRRVAPFLGEGEAARRVRVGRMDDLDAWADGGLDLVVALGVYQNAGDEAEWSRALRATARALAPGGLCLVANFTPESTGAKGPLRRVPGSEHRYDGFSSGPLMLLDAGDLDGEFRRAGLAPLVPTVTARRDADGARRVTANALYVRR